MNPTKCPNCRLSLPQNWSGANDPNAKCPYCGKPVAASPAAPAAPVPAPQPAPAPKAAAKTILWGAGMSLPMRPPGPPMPAPPAPPPPAPPPPAAPSVHDPGQAPAPPAAGVGLGDARTLSRSAVHGPAGAVRPGVPAPAAPAADVGAPGMGVAEAQISGPAAASPTSDRHNPPAPTVMYDSAVQVDPSLADFGKPSPDVDVASRVAPVEEPEPPAEPSPPPALTKVKGKGKPMQRKIYKPKSSLTKKRGENDDEDDALKAPSSNKLGLIIFLALVVCGLVVVGVIVLRGKGKTKAPPGEDTTEKAKPLLEPAPTPEPPALAPAEPAAPEEPEAPAKPARPTKAAAEKPTPAERPTRVERTRPEPAPAAEPRASGRPSEEDARRAREAYQRGNAKLLAGNASEAIAEFSQALKLNPKDPANRRALGLAHEQAGNLSEAAKQLRLYLRAAPKASDRAMVEKKLQQIRRSR